MIARAGGLAMAMLALLPAEAASGERRPAAPEAALEVRIDRALRRAAFGEEATAEVERGVSEAGGAAARTREPGAPAADADARVAPFDLKSRILTLTLLGGAVATLATVDTETVEDVGDVLQIALPAAALGSTWLWRDRRGRRQFLRAFLSSSAAVYLLKETVEKTRPNAQGVNSFPSGHTAAAFSGATFVDWRYGTRWGAPALVLAGYTGASRILAEKHFLDDVISGMSISLLSTRYFVSPGTDRVALSSRVTDEATGLTVVWTPRSDPATGEALPRWRQEDAPLRGYRFEWEAGGASVELNRVAAPAATGDPIAFEFDEVNNPTVTARVELSRELGSRHELGLQVAPFEVRDFGRFAVDTAFAGEIVPAGTELRTQYLLYDYRARYRYRLAGDPPAESRVTARRRGLHLHAGAGLSFQDVVANLAWNGGEADLEEGNWTPFAHLEAGLELTRRLGLHFEADAGASADDRLLDAALTLRVHLDPERRRWDLGAGLRRIDRRIVTARLFNEHEREQVVALVGYRF